MTDSRIVDVITHTVGPEKSYTVGYLNPTGIPGKGCTYRATMRLSVATVKAEALERGTQRIVPYDQCESTDAYIGQMNMMTASSLCGPRTGAAGFDLAVGERPERRLFHTRDLFSERKGTCTPGMACLGRVLLGGMAVGLGAASVRSREDTRAAAPDDAGCARGVRQQAQHDPTPGVRVGGPGRGKPR
jgi:hypothetical protein